MKKNQKIVGALLAALGVIIFLVGNIYFSTNQWRFYSIEQVPTKKVAIVLGAQVRRNGSLSDVLADRVDAAIELYRRGKIEKILMTGDNGSVDYDEVSNMRKYALAKGLPESAIVLDYAGFSTYESCYRAKAIFGVEQAIVVTQNYHLPRAVYACRKLGVEAFGFGQPDWSRYPEFMIRAQPRELLAQLKMLWQIHVTHPKPKYLGEKEPITLAP